MWRGTAGLRKGGKGREECAASTQRNAPGRVGLAMNVEGMRIQRRRSTEAGVFEVGDHNNKRPFPARAKKRLVR